MAALSAAKHNPACRALYTRVRAKHPDKPSIAIGHVMRKLLHLSFAIWKSGTPFDPQHYPWEGPNESTNAKESRGEAQAAGHTPDEPARPVVTAACPVNLTETPAAVDEGWPP